MEVEAQSHAPSTRSSRKKKKKSSSSSRGGNGHGEASQSGGGMNHGGNSGSGRREGRSKQGIFSSLRRKTSATMSDGVESIDM